MTKHRATDAELAAITWAVGVWPDEGEELGVAPDWVEDVLLGVRDGDIPDSLAFAALFFSYMILRPPLEVMDEATWHGTESAHASMLATYMSAGVHAVAALAESKGIDSTPLLELEELERGDKDSFRRIRALVKRLWLIECGPLDGPLPFVIAHLRGLMAKRAAERDGDGKPAPVEIPATMPAPAEPADTPLTLSRSELLVLQAMARHGVEKLLSIEAIRGEIPPQDRLSEPPIRDAVNKLIENLLAERPDGERRGARLTLRGRRLADQYQD